MSFLGIDIGTSGCKSVAFDERGQIIASHYREYDTIRDATGRSEIDARDVWKKIAETIRVCVERTESDPISGISVTSMGESMVPLDANYQILRSKRARFRSAWSKGGDGAVGGGFYT